MSYPAIKYRGMPTKRGRGYVDKNFVYGSLITGLWAEGKFPVYEILVALEEPLQITQQSITMNPFRTVRVFPSSVARMICTLNNGQDLYENDIVTFIDSGRRIIARVVSDETRIYLRSGDEKYNLSEILAGEEENMLRIEGNAIQNQDLLYKTKF